MKINRYCLLLPLLLLLGSCQRDKQAAEPVPDVSLESPMTAFDGTICSVSVVLSHFIHSDVTVTLAIDGMDEEALPYDPVVVVPAGAVKRTVSLNIKPKLVELHKDYTISVRIVKAEGANLLSTAPVTLSARIDEYRNWDFEPEYHGEWSMYAYVPSGYEYCWIYMYAAPAYYAIDLFSAEEGDLSDPAFLLKRMDSFADAIQTRYEDNKDKVSAKTDVLCRWTGASGYAMWTVDGATHYVGTGEEGRWNLLMMEFDADLVPTGAYKNDAFTLAF